MAGSDLDTHDVSKLSDEDRNSIEADSFWCLSKLLDGIQDNYTFAQPGIQNRVRQLKELIERVDGTLCIINHNVAIFNTLFSLQLSCTNILCATKLIICNFLFVG